MFGVAPGANFKSKQSTRDSQGLFVWLEIRKFAPARPHDQANFRIATPALVMLFLPLMADPRALDAVRRIERALARIEAAASRPAPAVPPGEAPEEFERLREAHDALRRQVAGAIGQIDRMIETGERR